MATTNIQISRDLLFDNNLSDRDFHILCTLISFQDKYKSDVILKLKTISKRSGLSMSTVSRAVKCLKENGIIKVLNRYYTNANKEWRKGTNCYVLPKRSGNFVQIPFYVLTSNLPSTAFKVMCYLLSKENKGVAYPSLREMAKHLHLSIATVISSIKLLVMSKLIFKRFYIGKFHSFGRNQYTFNKSTSDKKIKCVCLKHGRNVIFVSAYRFTQIDLKSQYEYLKGVETIFT